MILGPTLATDWSQVAGALQILFRGRTNNKHVVPTHCAMNQVGSFGRMVYGLLLSDGMSSA